MTTNGSSPISIDRDVVFGQGGGLDLRLDVYRPPAGGEKRTAVIQLHGGGFRRGSKDSLIANCRLFAERGYVALASQYRLLDQGRWPAQIEDVKAAIRWTRTNAASLNVDPDKIAVAGYSAGGFLALAAAGAPDDPALEGSGGNAGVSSAVSACIAFYPGGGRSLREEGASETETDLMRFVKAGCPPTILLHSTGDTTVPFEASVGLFNALRAAGVAVELHLFDGLSHVFDRHPEFAAPAVEVCDLFLDRHVVKPRVYPPFVAGVARPG
ncbi:MAG TPA: alpha/beta hydrolase [Dehalococcoidia bacterium]|nr:alpha/beta hydrolase [Dehalococcoidia bacterium]